MASTSYITRHPVVTYFVLTFAISWGGFVFVVGPGGFPGTGSQFDALLPFVASAMLAGPAVAGLLLTVLTSGTAGLRELLSRLLRWRVGVHWYVAALLPAPLLSAAVLFALSLTSPIFTTPNRTAILLAGITAGIPISTAACCCRKSCNGSGRMIDRDTPDLPATGDTPEQSRGAGE